VTGLDLGYSVTSAFSADRSPAAAATAVLDRAEAAAEALLADGYRGWDPAADWLLTGDAAAVAEDLAELRDAGVDEVVVRPMADDSAEETLRQTAVARDRL